MNRSTYDDEWLLENYDKYQNNRQLLKAYNEAHPDKRTEKGLGYHTSQYLDMRRIRKFTKEEIAFLKEYYPVLIDYEFLDAFEARFGWRPAKKRIFQSACDFGIKKTPETRYRSKRMQNLRPLGSEHITKRGGQINVFVKVCDTGDWWTDWKPKQFVVWEEANGKIPKGHAIVFIDGNTTNCDLDNLMCIPKRYLGMMNKLFKNNSKDPELKKLKIEWCKLYDELKEKGNG